MGSRLVDRLSQVILVSLSRREMAGVLGLFAVAIPGSMQARKSGGSGGSESSATHLAASMWRRVPNWWSVLLRHLPGQAGQEALPGPQRQYLHRHGWVQCRIRRLYHRERGRWHL